MLPYQTDIDSQQKWTTRNADNNVEPVYYTFSSTYNTSDFKQDLSDNHTAISGNGDSAKWMMAMSAVMDVSNITFAAASSPTTAQLGLLSATITDPKFAGYGWSYPDPVPTITSGLAVIEGTQNSTLYIHELLHTLGMDHPGHGLGDAPAFAQYTADATIMRYTSTNDMYVQNKILTTPMVYDIALLQQKYGAHFDGAAANIINTIPIGGTQNIAHTLWEGGASGHDVIDASSAISATIDLRDGFNPDNTPHFSRVGGEVFALALDPKTNYQHVITIEDVMGAAFGVNHIYGNDADNKLTGGTKVDTLEGGAGHDTYMLTQAASATSPGANQADYVIDSDGDGSIVINGAPLAGLAHYVTNTSGATSWTLGGHTIRMVAENQIAIDSTNKTGTIALVSDNSFDMKFLGITLDDKTDGTAGNDSLGGGKYADLISGFAGNDTLIGNGGDDTLSGGTGADSLVGGAGNDAYHYAKLDGADTISDNGYNADDDTLTISGYASGAASYTRIGNTTDFTVSFSGGGGDSVLIKQGLQGGSNAIEHIVFTSGGGEEIDQIRTDVLAKQATAGNDTINGFYGAANTIGGGAGNDSLSGNSLTDQLHGDAGNDTLLGGYGNDTLSGGTGADFLQGGGGDDLFLFAKGDGTDTIQDYGNSTDLGDTLSITGYASTAALYSRIGNSDDFTVSFTGGTDSITVKRGLEAGGNTLEHITFAGGGDKTVAQLRTELLLKQTTSGNDVIVGFTGAANVISGAAGNDSITGSTVADVLHGDGGRDTLVGGYGNDSLTGGTGVDILTGGYNADSFIFMKGDTGAGASADHVTDFSRVQNDRIALLGYGLSAAHFVADASFHAGSTAEFGYTKVASGNYTLIRIDSDHNGTSDQEIRLDGIQLDMHVGDFVFA